MKILGLDLGSASVGWALIDRNERKRSVELLGIGVRPILYNEDGGAKKFQQGTGETPCSKRTGFRGMRRNIDRKQLHREQLIELLQQYGMLSGRPIASKDDAFAVWKLRADAASADNKLTLEEISRVLLHICHRRGYRHAKEDMTKLSAYVEKINSLGKVLQDGGLTPGEYFYGKLCENEKISAKGKRYSVFRIKEEVLPRYIYDEEVRRILKAQGTHYPEILTEEVQRELHNIILYQRPLKSCKHLVSVCEFESYVAEGRNGKKRTMGPKVAPASSPLAELCRLYEAVNNITLINPRRVGQREIKKYDSEQVNEKLRKFRYQYILNEAERERIIEKLNKQKKVDGKAVLAMLDEKNIPGMEVDALTEKGIKGNETLISIRAALKKLPKKRQEELLRFNLNISTQIDPVTGEERYVWATDEHGNPEYMKEPLYRLWHTLYSISDRDELFNALRKNFQIEDEGTLNALFALNFTSRGYARKSEKFIRQILPYLMRGLQYSEASKAAGVNHSGSITKEENEERVLIDKIPLLEGGKLRQPVVEKIVNQTINIVNALQEKYGKIDTVRIEMARELKQSGEARARTFSNNDKRNKENEKYAAMVREAGFYPTRRNILKMRLWVEAGGKCVYCGDPVSKMEFLQGESEIEHIIPISRYFDDSYSNKVCAHRDCNHEKGNRLAYEYMLSLGEQKFNKYIEHVHRLHREGQYRISDAKLANLLMEKVPEDFTNRNLNETAYIATKTMEVLRPAIRNVYASTGEVTAFFRSAWGYDHILHDLNFEKFKTAGYTEIVEKPQKDQIRKEERIIDWSKRRDHRHHAIDALVVALTTQEMIKHLNTLNQSFDVVEDSEDAPNGVANKARRNLAKWAKDEAHISREKLAQALESIAVAFKPNTKLTTPGKRYTDKSGEEKRTLVPRVSLHNSTKYGKKLLPVDEPKSFEDALNSLDMMRDLPVREELRRRLEENSGDIQATVISLEQNPILRKGVPLTQIPCYEEKIVYKCKIEEIKPENIKQVLDGRIKELLKDRYDSFPDNDKKDVAFQQSLKTDPLYFDAARTQKIKTVRRKATFSTDTAVVVARDEENKAIGFARPDGNHHAAIYKTSEGKIYDTSTTYWAAMKRKLKGLPVIVTDPTEMWDRVIDMEDDNDLEEIKRGLPLDGSEFLFSLQKNEMFVLGMSDDEWADAVASNDKQAILRHLYRVVSFSTLPKTYYVFRHHTVSDNRTDKKYDTENLTTKNMIRIRSLNTFFGYNPRKVRVDLLGNLILD